MLCVVLNICIHVLWDVLLIYRWIYPSNLPERAYQLSIIERALFANTLVVLPTGLGKTFIAAVVMFNLYRWYPTGKLIFMAPTKPLVNQQLDACQHIMGFDPADLSPAMTGRVQRCVHVRSCCLIVCVCECVCVCVCVCV